MWFCPNLMILWIRAELRCTEVWSCIAGSLSPRLKAPKREGERWKTCFLIFTLCWFSSFKWKDLRPRDGAWKDLFRHFHTLLISRMCWYGHLAYFGVLQLWNNFAFAWSVQIFQIKVDRPKINLCFWSKIYQVCWVRCRELVKTEQCLQ